ncbi:hypothetical protein [Sinisalibacter aestuarii]|uniref:Uncharacterized protein n=1 Tax=Sinisalibacter aestuarii TaxID=2949426 RepID=A0ABQ5LXT1_9RHOB|nr:hypothetical protein [Sinisalibacter aestuarii]GKY89066.1 hypothetical protein STA1M1_29350 [Sinisalibacter aestuarii]
MNFRKTAQYGLAAILAFGAPVPGMAQQFTTAAEVRPMLDATKAGWVAVREYDGKDLLYFTNLLVWRCGLDAIHYSVNGGAERLWDGERCYEGDAVPNAQKDSSKLPFVSFPLGSVETVAVRITYDDGGSDTASYARRDILTQ